MKFIVRLLIGKEIDVSKINHLKYYLTPNVVWRTVTRPEQNRTVLSTSAITKGLSPKHMGPLRMNGMDRVPPNIIR